MLSFCLLVSLLVATTLAQNQTVVVNNDAAVVINDDAGEQAAIDYGSNFPSVARLLIGENGEYVCSATVISNRCVITAKHCTFGFSANSIVAQFTTRTDGFFEDEIPGATKAEAPFLEANPDPRFQFFDGFDMALVVLESDIPAQYPPIPIQTRGRDTPFEMTGAGFGASGIGSTGSIKLDSFRRAFDNIVDSYGSFLSPFGPPGWRSTNTYSADFDDNSDAANSLEIVDSSSEQLLLEGITAGGDSGGPLFDKATGYIVGTLSAGFSTTNPRNMFGSISFHSGIGRFRDMVEQHCPDAVFKNVGGASFDRDDVSQPIANFYREDGIVFGEKFVGQDIDKTSGVDVTTNLVVENRLDANEDPTNNIAVKVDEDGNVGLAGLVDGNCGGALAWRYRSPTSRVLVDVAAPDGTEWIFTTFAVGGGSTSISYTGSQSITEDHGANPVTGVSIQNKDSNECVIVTQVIYDPTCGNGIIDTDLGEQCDTESSTTTCDNECTSTCQCATLPKCNIDVESSPYEACQPLGITGDGSESSEGDTEDLTFNWQIACDGGSRITATDFELNEFPPITPGACSENCTIFLAVTDRFGLTSSCSTEIEVVDTTAPELFDVFSSLTECDPHVPPVLFPPSPSFIECSGVDLEASTFDDEVEKNSCATITRRTGTLVDICGNSREARTQIIVNSDSRPPSIVAPVDITLECGSPLTGAEFQASDTCSSASVQVSLERKAQWCGKSGTFNVTGTARDLCGLEAKADYLATFSDTTPPIVKAEPWTGYFRCSNIPTFPQPEVSDNCADPSDLVIQFKDLSDDGVAINITATCPSSWVREWTVTDPCGHVTVVEQPYTRELEGLLLTEIENNPNFAARKRSVLGKQHHGKKHRGKHSANDKLAEATKEEVEKSESTQYVYYSDKSASSSSSSDDGSAVVGSALESTPINSAEQSFCVTIRNNNKRNIDIARIEVLVKGFGVSKFRVIEEDNAKADAVKDHSLVFNVEKLSEDESAKVCVATILTDAVTSTKVTATVGNANVCFADETGPCTGTLNENGSVIFAEVDLFDIC